MPGVWLVQPEYMGRSRCERMRHVLTGTFNLTASFKVLNLSIRFLDIYAVIVTCCENRKTVEKNLSFMLLGEMPL